MKKVDKQEKNYIKHVFVCEDSNENILTGIFDAFSYRNKSGNNNIDIIITDNGSYNCEFFAEYEDVKTNYEKALKTMKSIHSKLGDYIKTDVLRALCHFDKRRGYYIFRYLEICFKNGAEAAANLKEPNILKVMELSRKTWNETHLYYGFVRFTETYGCLYATIEPKCNVLPLLMAHFTDRYPGENWIIHDKTRNHMIIHKAFSEPFIIMGNIEEIMKEYKERYYHEKVRAYSYEDTDKYEYLWKDFFEAIAIEERYNPGCQQNHMPLWMRKHIKEVMP